MAAIKSKQVSAYKIAVIASIAAAAAVIIAVAFVMLSKHDSSLTSAANSSNTGTLTIISVSGGSLIDRSKYVISPDRFGNSGNYTIQDGSSADENKAAGIVEISGLPVGRYVVTQLEASPGYQKDRLSKIVEIKDQGDDVAATFNNIAGQEDEQQQTSHNSTTQIRNLIYNVKFECGTISGGEGPLRPGHYDTDIGILNKQNFEVKIQWSVTANDSKNTNSIIKMLEAQGSTSIVCKDLYKLLGNDQKFVEGFVIINMPLEPGLLTSLSNGTQVLGRSFEDINNLLEVQAFYTANALDELPHELLVDKITFAIVNDTSGKIPVEMIKKTLDITLPSQLNEISDPEMMVKGALAEKYALSAQDLANLQIEIRSVSAGIGTMIDDHAISSSTVMPQASG
jgi:Prealbumin-like fold domain